MDFCKKTFLIFLFFIYFIQIDVSATPGTYELTESWYFSVKNV